MGKKKKKSRYCLKCGTNKKLTRHHLWPKRYYKGAGPVGILCRRCHNELEEVILDAEATKFSLVGSRELSANAYEDIFYWFIVKS